MRSALIPVFGLLVGFTSVALGGCGGGDSGNGGPPTQPPPPEPQVASISVTPSEAAIEHDSTVDFDAEALDEAGNPIPDVTFTWSVADPSVATADSEGIATGLEEGRTRVIASAEDEQGSAPLKVRSGRTIEVDSTRLELVSDSTERAQGTLRFRVREGSPPEIERGDYLVGLEHGGFLRKVEEVSTTASEVVARTQQASMAQVFDSLSFQTTVTFGEQSQADVIRRGDAHWGPVESRYTAPGVTFSGGEIDLDGVTLVDEEVCTESETGTACTDFRLEITSGQITFNPGVDVAVDIGTVGVESLHAIAEGDLNFDARAEATGGGTLAKSSELSVLQLARPFSSGPVGGEVRLNFYLGYTTEAEGRFSVGGGFDSDFGTRMGAEYAEGSWSRVFSVQKSLDPLPLITDVGGETRVRVYVRPQIKVIFYTVAGPSMFTEPYFLGEATFGETCTFELAAGLDGGLGFHVEILGRELTSFERSLAIARTALASRNLGCGGDLEVSASTTGDNLDPDGYTVTVDGAQSSPIDPNGTITFSGLTAGDHEVELSGIQENCSVDGSNPRTATVEAGTISTTSFAVSCSAQPPSVDLGVRLDRRGSERQDDLNVAGGESVIVEWSTDGEPAECTASGAWGGIKDPAGGDQRTEPLAAPEMVTYVLTCMNTASSATDTAEVMVRDPNAFHVRSDRRDELSGEQVHVFYVTSADGRDRELDLDGTITGEIRLAQEWFSEETSGRTVRFDTYGGSLDVTFVRLSGTNSDIVSAGEEGNQEIVEELKAMGFDESLKRHIVFYDGRAENGSGICGETSGPFAVLFLQECDRQFEGPLTGSVLTWWDVILHEFLHTVGLVDEDAPNHCRGGHACDAVDGDGVKDLMGFDQQFDAKVLDLGRDDYYSSDGLPAGVKNLHESPFLTTEP